MYHGTKKIQENHESKKKQEPKRKNKKKGLDQNHVET